MSDGLTGLLEGLAGGFESGYGFREAAKGRKRRQKLEEDLMALRQLEARRAETRGQHEDILFQEQQDAYQRAQRLREEVGTFLRAPRKFKSLGDYVSGKPGTREAPPLSADATTAQHVGRVLGQFGGRELTDEEALLVGSGQVPGSAIAPKAYHPRTRQEYLENLRYAAGLRGKTEKLPITLDKALQVVDNIYGMWKLGERVGHHLAPAQRMALAKKMVEGTVQPEDLPDIPSEIRSDEPPPAPEPSRRGSLADWVKGLFRGGEARAVPAPGAGAPPTAPTEQPGQRVDRARVLIGQYRDLPVEDLEQALRDEGYDEDEIRTILGSPNP